MTLLHNAKTICMTRAHFTANELINATNPVAVNLVGVGGTGSQVLTALARINHTLVVLGHAGLQVNVFDSDTITAANQGRQLFADAEVGLHKSIALVNRVNRFFGTNWKAHAFPFDSKSVGAKPTLTQATITISCVDNVAARFDIAAILERPTHTEHNHPLYWMDFGNSRYTGQVLLSTVGEIKQPNSKKFETVAQLPYVTETYAKQLQQADETDNTPSCSLAEALDKQDLFINSALVQMGSSLLLQLFREGMIFYKGLFMNLHEYRTQPIAV